MNRAHEPKECRFHPAARREIRSTPDGVRGAFGRAIRAVQQGVTPGNAKPLHGYGSGVLEIVEDFDTDAYRAVYTVRFRDAVYVLAVFQKKSKSGSKTPQHILDLVRERLRWAEQDHAGWIVAKER